MTPTARLRPALLLGLASLALIAAAPDLRRSARLGVAPQPLSEAQAATIGRPGVAVATVIPGTNGAAIGLVAGDVILAVNGRPVASPTTLVSEAGSLRAGDALALEIWREGKVRALSSRVVGRPFETYPDARVAYGAIPFGAGRLREIVALPNGVAEPPVVFFIQGYNCGSVEQPPEHGYSKLVAALLAAKIGVYRIDKPGTGDSEGPERCEQIGFDTEVRAFEAGYRALREKHGVPPERIIIFGHSMGGLIAPLIASRNPPPRGVALFGGVLRSWEDYLNGLLAFQAFEARGADPAEGELFAAGARSAVHRYLSGGETPAKIASDNPELAEAVRLGIGWEGGDAVAGRHYRYWQEIASARLVAAWRDTRAHVLSLYGESDFAALNDVDHKLIAEVVNHYRPGTASYVEVPRTDHGMTLAGTRREVRARAQSPAGFAPPPFNEAVATQLIGWIGETMRRPPVPAKG